jgi:hypothetical protein
MSIPEGSKVFAAHRKITIGTVLFWFTVLPGCAGIALTLAALYMLATGAAPGTPIYLDEDAPTKAAAILQLLWGVGWVALPFLLRGIVRRRAKRFR